MISVVVIGGSKVRLDQNKVLGAGGEATVVRHGNKAIKIYHNADSDRVDKLKYFCKANLALPKNVCAPDELVYNGKGNIVGFSMPLIPSGKEVVQELSRKSFRKSHPKCDSEFVSDLFLHAYKTTESLHGQNVVVGDYNDLNFLFDVSNPIILFIDVDSYQIGNHPCMVGTENYLHPSLYGLNLADKPYFKNTHDWYAFWCMYIKSLLLCHPYGGVHNQFKSIPQRALAKVLAWDSGVKYPKAAYSPDMLNDGLMGVVEQLFKQGKAFKPDIDVIEDFKESLVQCRSCGVKFPSIRKSCPQCTKVNTQQIQRKVKVVSTPGKMNVNVEELLSTDGNFIWHKVYGTSIFAIALNKGQYEVHHHTSNTRKHLGNLPVLKESLKFDMFAGRYLVVGKVSSENVIILDMQDNFRQVGETTCDLFQGERSFVCTEKYLARAKDGWLYRCHIDPVLGYVEDRLRAVMENQTWFDCSSVNGGLFGYQRFFNNLQFFFCQFEKKTGDYFDIDIPDFEPHESMLDTAVYFTSNSVLLVVKTEIKGKIYTRVYVIRSSTGEILSHYRLESMPSDTHRNIHGKSFVRPSGTAGFILHPTDDGVVQEVVGQDRIGKLTIFAETEQFISESDSLINHGQGIIIVGDRLINHLTLS